MEKCQECGKEFYPDQWVYQRHDDTDLVMSCPHCSTEFHFDTEVHQCKNCGSLRESHEFRCYVNLNDVERLDYYCPVCFEVGFVVELEVPKEWRSQNDS